MLDFSKSRVLRFSPSKKPDPEDEKKNGDAQTIEGGGIGVDNAGDQFRQRSASIRPKRGSTKRLVGGTESECRLAFGTAPEARNRA